MNRGRKDDVWIYRLVAQSNNNELPVSEIISLAKNNSIYKILERLAPLSNDIPGKRLFCFDDLINYDAYDDVGNIVKVSRYYKGKRRKINNTVYNFTSIENPLDQDLCEKLIESYGYFFHGWSWEKVKVRHISSQNTVNKRVIIELNNNNSVSISLKPKENDDTDKVEMIFRKEIRNNDRIGEYSSIFWKAVLLRCKHRRYVNLRIPLIPFRYGKRLFYKTLSNQSYYFPTNRYLYRKPNQKSIESEKNIQRKIENIIKSNLSEPVKVLKITNLQEKRKEIWRNIRNHNLSMNVRGLLKYSQLENSLPEFNKRIEKFAESSGYDSPVHELIPRYDSLGITKSEEAIHYHTRKDFPFLTPDYNIFKCILPQDFSFGALKKIANTTLKESSEIHSREDLISKEDLKQVVTRHFFEEMKIHLSRAGIITMGDEWKYSTAHYPENILSSLQSYHSEIFAYLENRDKKYALIYRSKEVLDNLEYRYKKLFTTLISLIRNSNPKTIPIIDTYKYIQKSQLTQQHVWTILDSMNKDYGKQFVITLACFISKHKAKEFKSFLRTRPKEREARKYLLKNGVPAPCILEDIKYGLFRRLGFVSVRTKYDHNEESVIVDLKSINLK
jgi:hypothetical protein